MPRNAGSTKHAHARTLREEIEFLRAHTASVVVLGNDPAGPRVVIVPEYQARVMLSSPTGDPGIPHGWINNPLIASGQRTPHINAVGGEDRFWIGPEGGQFSVFFPPGTDYSFDQWQTPAAIDTEPYTLVESSDTFARFAHTTTLTNASRTIFELRIEREIALLADAAIAKAVGCEIDRRAGVRAVGFESRNQIGNIGDRAWTRDSGLLSIWIPGMFKPGARTTVVLPFQPGPDRELGSVVNDAYFGRIPPDRLAVGEGVVFFRADAQLRGKLGLSPAHARPTVGSWAPLSGVLTIVQHSEPASPDAAYVNSMWCDEPDPYAGDVINSYNDGPTTPGGKAIGGFYEIETSSPALALAPGQAGAHNHRTMHFVGPRPAIDAIARCALGVGLDGIEAVFGGG